ncbi:VOC family protein [Helicobacter typhlonius]|uniref:VOC family protein n=1 Tax=Helicobacter typhlonius TaxID=76936 RepID=UPI002FE070AB
MAQSIYPVLMTDKLQESSLFYKTYLGFAQNFSSDWYINLSHPDGGELALIDVTHESIPALYRANANGILINLEVANATQMYDFIKSKDERIIVVHLADEVWGWRHFIIKDPNNVLIDIIEVLPPSAEFLNNDSSGVL